MVIPENSELHTAVLPQSGLPYRLRLTTVSDEEITLFNSSESSKQGWQEVEVSLEAYWGTARYATL